MLRAPLSTTGELGGDYGASTTRRKVSAAVPGATTGIPRVASQTKQNKTKHFSGPPSSSSHPLHYPGDPYYVNSVASEMSVDRPTSQVAAGCCSTPRTRGVGGTGVTPKVVDIYLDGVAGGSGRPFSAGLILFLEAGTTFSGYLQQRIGDNQGDNNIKAFKAEHKAGGPPGKSGYRARTIRYRPGTPLQALQFIHYGW